jgi:hypothetical protein
VFFLAIVLCIQVSSALKFLQDASIYLVMSFFMSLFFLLHLSIPQRDPAIILVSFLNHPQPQGITVLLMCLMSLLFLLCWPLILVCSCQLPCSRIQVLVQSPVFYLAVFLHQGINSGRFLIHLKNSLSWRTITSLDSCASPTGAFVLVPPIIGNHGASAAQEIPPLPNPPGASCLPINVSTRALGTSAPIRAYDTTVTVSVPWASGTSSSIPMPTPVPGGSGISLSTPVPGSSAPTESSASTSPSA